MDGLWILLLAAFGIASAVMKRIEKSSSSGERPQSSELKRYLDSVGNVMKEIESTFDESDSEEKASPPQTLRRRVARSEEPAPASRQPRIAESPKVHAQVERTAKIPPIHEVPKPKTPRISQKQMREAIIWSEILQPPVSKRKK